MANPSDSRDQGDEDSDPVDRHDDADGNARGKPADRAGRNKQARSGTRSSSEVPTRSARSTKRAVERLDERERRLSFAAAGAAVVFGTLVYLLDTHNPHFRLAKGQITPQTTLVLGIVSGVLLLVATCAGRRAPVGFVALLTFLIFGTYSFFLGTPFLALAAWLLYRSYKIQRDASANLRAARADGSRSAPPATGASKSTKSAKLTSAPSRGASKKGPAGPEANKRYTPKRPVPPPPKPSRRERKAAEAAD